MVPIMACAYFIFTVIIILTHLGQMPDVFARIFQEAFGFRQVAAGGFGAVLMNGVKRGLFSNEAGSGSAPCAAAAAKSDDAVKIGLVQSLGVFIDTIVICTCTAMILLLVPQELTNGLVGMDLLQSAMQYHLGTFGTIFIAATLAMFSFSTFIGILFYARSNVAYLFGNKWCYQTAYKIVALVMLFIGGLAAYTTVWDLGDVGVGLMTIFNLIALYPMGGQALNAPSGRRKIINGCCTFILNERCRILSPPLTIAWEEKIRHLSLFTYHMLYNKQSFILRDTAHKVYLRLLIN